MIPANAHLKLYELKFALRRWRRRLALGRGPFAMSGPVLRALFDRFESLGDVCELAGLQRAANVERPALFNWRDTTIPLLTETIDANLAGVEDINNLRIDLQDTQHGRREFMLWHAALNAYSHTFVLEGQATAEEMLQREHRALVLLKRKFLGDLAQARRIYVFCSTRPIPQSDAETLLQALQRKGDNTLLYVSFTEAPHRSGDVTRVQPNLLRGHIDAQAHSEHGMKSAHWPLLLQNALAALEEPAREREAAL